MKEFANQTFNQYVNLPKTKIMKELNTNKQGISNNEANKRLEIFGSNEIKKIEHLNWLKILVSQFTSPLILVLIFAGIISYIAGEQIDMILIIIIVLFNAIIGFRQEYSAEKIIESLQKMASPRAKVLRQNKIENITSNDVVPGDIILLEAGDIIPADARIIECHNFYVLESILTGESTQVEKIETPIDAKLVTNAKNMVFSGTTVTKGKAYAIVTATGNHTEIGQIAKKMQETDTKIPLIEKLKRLSTYLSMIISAIIILVFIIGLLNGHELLTMFKIAVSLGVAAIPEGLPVVVTITLALGIKKIAEKKALIRKMPSIETLGSIDMAFLDKTGTITKNEMTVTEIWMATGRIDINGIGYTTNGTFSGNANQKDLKKLVECAFICNDSEHRKNYSGDPTEIALLVMAEKYMKQFSTILPNHHRKKTIEFTSERKMMTVLSDKQYTKGAPEKMISSCDRILVKGQVKTFTKEMKQTMLDNSKTMMTDALRVLAFAYRDTAQTKKEQVKEKNMIFIGLTGMIDPPRESVAQAVKEAHNAGIKVKIITGDHALTAKAIGEMIGLSDNCKVVEGKNLSKLIKKKSPLIEEADVFARVTPNQKIQIIEYFENKGYTTAMTGDGVNDAPALKKASMGIAVAEGTDVAKAGAQMILLETHFQTILNAIEVGRGIMDNIRKFVLYLLTSNLAEIGVVSLATIFGYPLPLTAVQLLWINLVTDGPPAIALSLDPPAKNIMLRKPEGKKSNIITSKMKEKIVTISVLMTALLMFIVNFAKNDVVYLQTMIFTALVMFESVRIFSVRKEFGQPLFNNKWIVISLAMVLALHIIILYVPQTQAWFNVMPLNINDWAILIIITVILLLSDKLVDILYNEYKAMRGI